jgi:hypothetical protein
MRALLLRQVLRSSFAFAILAIASVLLSGTTVSAASAVGITEFVASNAHASCVLVLAASCRRG